MGLQFQINPTVSNIPYGDRLKIIDATQGKKDLADLASGNPKMAMPVWIREQLKANVDLGYAPYTDFYGLPELRDKISQYLKAACQITADPKTEVLVTQGVQEALYVVMRTILSPGDQVLIPSPHYGNYYLNTIACGAEPVLVPLDEEDGFMPDCDRLEGAITPRTKALVFSNPNNPLGVVWPREVLEKIAHLAQAHNLILLVDEVYREFFYPDRPVSIGSLPGMKEHTFTFNGFSKAYVMMGLRTGYVAGPAELMAHVKRLHYVVALCPSSLGQAAALAAFDCPREQLEPIYQTFRGLVETLYEHITAIPGVSCVNPRGGFYLFPNVKRFGLSSLDLALELIEKAGVITLPGTEFGSAGEGYLRLSVAANREQVEKACERLTKFAREFS